MTKKVSSTDICLRGNDQDSQMVRRRNSGRMTRGVSLLLTALPERGERQLFTPQGGNRGPLSFLKSTPATSRGPSVKTCAYTLDSTGYSIKMSFLKQTEGFRGMSRIKTQQVTTWHLLENCPEPTRVTLRPPPGHRRGPCRRGSGSGAKQVSLNQHFRTITTSSDLEHVSSGLQACFHLVKGNEPTQHTATAGVQNAKECYCH